MNKLLKSCFGLGLALLACGQLLAQKYDNVWMWGEYIRYQDSTNAPYYGLWGNEQGTFKNDTFLIQPQFRNMGFWNCYGGICDVDGNLQFYTNGMWILDSTGTLIQNGDSLNYGNQWNELRTSALNGDIGYSSLYGLIIIPEPGSDTSFYILHQNIEQIVPAVIKMNYTKVCKTQNGYRVMLKNVVLSTINLTAGNMAVCKHANGRDWWFIFVEYNSNCMYEYLITPDTIAFYNQLCTGMKDYDGELGKASFSADGTKFMHSASYTGMKIFDFDRCSGTLSNYRWTDWVVERDTNGAVIGAMSAAEFSSNDSFVYGITGSRVYQYDLTAPILKLSKDTVGENDHAIDTLLGPPYTYGLNFSQYGADGKIYIAPAGSRRYLSTIASPNSRGDSSNFLLRNITLKKLNAKTVPLFPNYRLGRLIGSACDTIYSDLKPIYTQAPSLKVFPNPSNDEVQFDYNWIEWERSAECRLLIADLSGRAVMEVSIPKYSTRQSFSIKQLTAGTYLVSLRGGSPLGVRGLGSRVLATCKLVKQ